MASQKISSFTGQSLLDNSDLFTFVRSSTNFNVSFSDFKNELGVTGTLNQVGDPLGAPVLDQPDSNTNNIRNLESGEGILASVSVQDGIIIKTDFIQGSAGIPLIKSLTAKQQLFKSLVAGNGISIDDIGDDIRLTAIEAIISTKTVIISQESDFPLAVGGVITLEPSTKYQIVNDITTANRFIMQDRTVMAGDGPNLSRLTYTGSDIMFTWVDSTVDFENLRANAPLATLFSGSSPSSPTASFIIRQCTFESCEAIGTISDIFGMTWADAAFLAVNSSGLLFGGSLGFVLLEASFVVQQSGTILDFGTCTFDGFTLINSVVIGTGASVFLDGLPNSGNVNAGGIGTIVNNRSQGPLTIGNIGPNDALWQFALNDTIPDTRPDGLISLVANSTETVISSSNTPVIINAVWSLETTSQFDSNTSGRMTYIGGKNAKLPIDVSATLLTASGGDKQCTLYIAINGSIINQTGKQATLNNSKAASVTAIWQHDFAPNDYVEAWVENNADTINIVCQQGVQRVN